MLELAARVEAARGVGKSHACSTCNRRVDAAEARACTTNFCGGQIAHLVAP